jgi:hypothetical protein
LLAAYVDIALEHHEAIWLLRQSSLIGSAIALVRPVYDTYLRALWINAVATPEQIERASRDELKFPPMHQLRDNIKKAYFGTPAWQDAENAKVIKRFFEFFEALWRILSSYIHSGGRQLARRFTGDQVKPSYSDSEIAQALNLPTMALMLLLRVFFVEMKCHDEANEIEMLLMQYFAEFNQRLNKGE